MPSLEWSSVVWLKGISWKHEHTNCLKEDLKLLVGQPYSLQTPYLSIWSVERESSSEGSDVFEKEFFQPEGDLRVAQCLRLSKNLNDLGTVN